MEQVAQVKRIIGNKAVIDVPRQGACHSCELSAGCGTGSLGRLLGHRNQSLMINNDHELKIGDRVIIGIPDHSFLSAGFLVYLMPLASLFSFAILSDWLFNSVEWLNMVAAVAGLGFGLLAAGWLAKHHYSKDMQPQYIRHVIALDSIQVTSETNR